MKHALPITLLALLTPVAAHAGERTSFTAWPPKWSLPDGTELGLTGNAAYDTNHVVGAELPRLEDADGWRRQEFGFVLRRKGVYDVGAAFDFEARTWMDVSLRVEGKALTGHDIGRFRLGQSKLPLGFEGNTATRNSLFLENSLATQAFYPGRRIGVDWSFERPTHLLNAGYYGSDLQGNHRGHVLAGRAAWTPVRAQGHVVHLGLAATREHPDGEIDGRGIAIPASARWRARPEAGLTATRLVDSGTLTGVDRIERAGVEALWIQDAWSLQAEHLGQRTQRDGSGPDYRTTGGYIAGSWVLTGESRAYSAGNVANPVPVGRAGAVELTARHSWIDLDDAGIGGGRETNWTVGANWYPNRHFKLQANLVRVEARRGAERTDTHLLLLRTQAHF